MLYAAWRYGGNDPYRTYNALDESYRPLGGGDPRPPPYPWRVRMFIYGCAIHAMAQDGAGGRAGEVR